LDDNNFILGFEDKVYDFHLKQFREGTPEDIVTMSTGHFSKDVENDDHTTYDEIDVVLRGMHEFDESHKFVMHNLSTGLVGERVRDRYTMWTGSGGNGKGITKNIAACAFGEYYYEPGAGLFSNRSVSGSCLSSELSGLKGKRLCIISECESKDSLLTGLVKQCTGHDLIQSRDLFKTAITWRNNEAMIIQCFNECPVIPDTGVVFFAALF
jgi:phage/plasmid-associated DNA primase